MSWGGLGICAERRSAIRMRVSVATVASLLLVVGATSVFSGTMSLPGQFSVSATGAATYAIPIAVPPGTAGMTPSLSLEYSSQGGDGVLGVGWTLSGLPSMARCARTTVQDGASGTINFDANDRFCLDGQRLVPISGAYGADGTQYRTEVESFSKIISHGTTGSGPAWFEVHTKSGQTMEFGNGANSQVLAQGKSSVRVWTLNKISDTKSNYYTVTYTNDAANGQFYPARIDYTGNSATSLAPYNSVQFTYAARPDVSPQYQAGSLSKTTVRLTNVKTFTGSTAVTDYRLSYQTSPGTGRSRLINVQTCDGAATPNCFPATTFNWQDTTLGFNASYYATGQGFSSTSISSAPGGCGHACGTYGVLSGGPGLIAADFDGDGRTDLIQPWNHAGYLNLMTYRSNGDGTFAFRSQEFSGFGFDSIGNGNGPGLIPLDLNGDGKTDLIQQWNYGSGTLYLMTYISNGDGTFTAGIQNMGQGFNSTGQGGPGLIAVDVNGDGRTDLVQQYNNGGYFAVFTYLSNGDGTFSTHYQTFPGYGYNSTGSGPGLFPVDLNGDGKGDLIAQWNNGGVLNIFTYISNGDGTFTVGAQNLGQGYDSTGQGGPGLVPLDVNGDGKTDLIQQYNNGGYFAVFTYISKGDGTFTTSYQTFPGYGFNSTGTGDPGLIALDLNGDGKGDLIAQWNNSGTLNIFTYLSNGDGTFTVGGQSLGNGYNSNGQGSPGLIPVDLPGLGKSGLIQQYQDGSGRLGLLIYRPSTPYPDLLTKFTGGLGSTTSVTYTSLSSGTAYTKDTSAAFPQLDLQSPLYTVSRVDSSNGVSGTYSSTYSYAGAKVDLSGRGFLGFRQTGVKDLQTGISDTTNYRQDFPYLGLVASTARTVGTQTLGQSVNTYQFSNAAGAASVSTPSLNAAPYRVSLAQNVSSGADLDGSALPTMTTSNLYDAYLNATQVVVSTPDGFSKTTNNTYTNDTSNWFLGRLTAASVASQTPGEPGQYCSVPWGSTITAGQSVTAYSAANPPVGQSCASIAQTRSCTNGVLSGSNWNQTCSAICALPWGGTIAQGQSVAAYSSATVPAPNTCSSAAETRTCGASGLLSGSFTGQSCVVRQPKTIFLLSGNSWSVPSDWNNAINKVELVGGGGEGAIGYLCGGGAGGGGAYSSVSNIALTPGASVAYHVGAGGSSGGYGAAGGDSWFGASSFAAAPVAAKGGGGGANDTAGSSCAVHAGGAGGQAASGIGAVKYSGGAGGSSAFGGGGGGGAAGRLGPGAAGGAYGGGNYSSGAGGGGADNGTVGGNNSSYVGGTGGNSGYSGSGGAASSNTSCSSGTNGGGGSGGYTGACGGGFGGAGTEWTASNVWNGSAYTGSSAVGGSGGGGGGGGAGVLWPSTSAGRPGGAGGLYGAGGGGSASVNDTGGTGAQGIIVITYTPAI